MTPRAFATAAVGCIALLLLPPEAVGQDRSVLRSASPSGTLRVEMPAEFRYDDGKAFATRYDGREAFRAALVAVLVSDDRIVDTAATAAFQVEPGTTRLPVERLSPHWTAEQIEGAQGVVVIVVPVGSSRAPGVTLLPGVMWIDKPTPKLMVDPAMARPIPDFDE